jgi:predicted porin
LSASLDTTALAREIELKTHRICIGVVAGLLAGEALAQDSSVALYGRMYLSGEVVQVTDVPAGQDHRIGRVSNNSSLFGIRGTEALGGGLQAWFQLESSVTADAGGGTIAGRNSGVGLTSTWGTVMMGMWDSPYKAASPRFDPFNDSSIASEEYIVGQTSSIPGQPFKIRIQNTVQGGLQRIGP